MPMPPILPTVDWRAVFATGTDFTAWLAGSERPENRHTIETSLERLRLEPQVEAHLQALPRVVHVVAIAEDWCGYVVRHVPALQRMALATDRIKIAFITREQHRGVFARFLTNGGEAIPKFIFLNHEFVECGNWGPMPAACRKLIARGKACGDVKAAREKVAALYQADADLRMVIEELLELVDTASAAAP